jgi:hypothetical protein
VAFAGGSPITIWRKWKRPNVPFAHFHYQWCVGSPHPRSASPALDIRSASISNPAQSDFSGPTADRPAGAPGSHTTRRSARPAAPRAARATNAATQAIPIASRPASPPMWPPDQGDKALRLLEELVPAGADPATSSPTSIAQDLAPFSERSADSAVQRHPGRPVAGPNSDTTTLPEAMADVQSARAMT